MNDIRKQFLEIIADVRVHLEYLHALGVRAVELPPRGSSSRVVPAAPPSPARISEAAATPGQGAAPSLPAAPSGLDILRKEIGDCTRCKLHKGRKNLVYGEGDPRAVLMFVGEGPGSEEDQQGRPFVGEAGQLLTDIIVKGMKLKREDVYICNIVKCRPPGNRNPEPDEVATCLPFLKGQIAAIKPAVIVTLGNVPTQNLLGIKDGITKVRGTWQTYEGIPVMPTFHPAYLLRNPGEKKLVWEDIKKVMERLGLAVPAK
jgi:DNA polymerase